MSGFWAVFKRELLAFFVTPLAWVLILVFLAIQGLHFYILVDQFSSAPDAAMGDQSPVSAFFGNTAILYFILFLLVPPLTMRSIAEERRSGTIETLLTAPLGTTGIVLAKFAAALVTYMALWLPTALYLVILQRSGAIDWNVAFTSYLGVLLVGAGYLSIGLLASSLTSSQFIALISTALILMLLFLVGLGEFGAKDGSLRQAVASYVSVWAQMNDFASGVIDSRRLVFDGTLIVVPLFLTVKVLDGLRYGGAS